MRFSGSPFKASRMGAQVAAALLAGASFCSHAGTPYTGTAINLPATFEAENFDKGGQGSGYNDTTAPNDGGQYRTSEGVDIVASTSMGGYAVNNFRTGEWLAYTINVPAAGKYDLAIHAANNGNPGAFHLQIDGVKVTGSIAVPKTGGWDTFAWVGANGINLPAGQHVLKVVSDTQYFNLNAVRATATAGAAAAPVKLGTPYSGTPVALPGTIEAENFDKGGEGLGYRDLSSGNSGGQYRTSESVDIIVANDATGGGAYAVSHFQTGEWLAYTVNVTAAGKYDLAIRAANNGNPGAFHLELNGARITDSIAVPKTGGWNQYAWIGASGIVLPAGQHQLKLVSDAQYFNVNSLRAVAAATASAPTAPSPTAIGTPFTGTPIKLPIVFEAENFDKGGEGLGYREVTAGNAGGLYRTSESVDIIASADTIGGGYVVSNFNTGEWLAYTINVPSSGNYDLSIRAANNGATSAFHFEVDGKDVTGRVSMPNTGSWTSFVWAGKQNVPLTAGKHVLKLVADQQYFNVNSISAMVSGTAIPVAATSTSTLEPAPAPAPASAPAPSGSNIPTSGVAWACDFENGSLCQFSEHSKLEYSGGRRSSAVPIARSMAKYWRLVMVNE